MYISYKSIDWSRWKLSLNVAITLEIIYLTMNVYLLNGVEKCAWGNIYFSVNDYSNVLRHNEIHSLRHLADTVIYLQLA